MAEKDLEQSIREWLDNGYLHEAFERVLLKKISSDGYIDISAYSYNSQSAMYPSSIPHKIHQARYTKLIYCDSKFCDPYHWHVIAPQKTENIPYLGKTLLDSISRTRISTEQLSLDEAEALVDIVLSQIPRDDRMLLLCHIFNTIRYRAIPIEFDSAQTASWDDDTHIMFDRNIINIKWIKCVTDLLGDVARVSEASNKNNGEAGTLFYRGHEQVNYVLQPKVMWSQRSRESERKIYQEMMVSCPSDLLPRHSHLERLALMQHYGLPTRLLDVTRNPLVALYMAVKGSYQQAGEIFVLSPEAEYIKYHDSDIVSVLASIALFDDDDKSRLCKLVEDTVKRHCERFCDCDHGQCKLREEKYDEFKKFNKDPVVHRLIHEVNYEKPGFLPEIVPCQLIKKYFVNALKDNARIIRQDGAFILSGLETDHIKDPKVRTMGKRINQFRYAGMNEEGEYEKLSVFIIPHARKSDIKKDLNNISINLQTLMPDIADVASDLTAKYC